MRPAYLVVAAFYLPGPVFVEMGFRTPSRLLAALILYYCPGPSRIGVV